MATIKSFTSLEQSNKLAEILPLESADMNYHTEFITKNLFGVPMYEYKVDLRQPNRIIDWTNKCIPCWSLVALLDVLPEYNLQKTDWGNGKIEYKIVVTTDEDNYASKNYDNPLDACYELVVKLHELKML